MPLGCALWSAVLLAEHETMVLMLIIKSRLTVGLTSATITILTLILASGNLRYADILKNQQMTVFLIY